LDERTPAEIVGAYAGLNYDQSYYVVELNDGAGLYHPHTFAEIADRVGAWFPS
jgi:hypothetical protein